MRTVMSYTVVPRLPQKLEVLRKIANNVWWSWSQQTRELFTRLDRDLWEATGHNPVALLGRISQERLEEAAKDEGFLAHLNRVAETLDAYLNSKSWYQIQYPDVPKYTFAYFSAEFGLHEALPVYSGGLGLLAGDHLKAASGIGIPLVGVGLFYYNGYFRQYLNADGWQQEYLHPNDFNTLPCTLERDAEGRPITVGIELPGREVRLQVWRVDVGRIQLYLLDSKLDANRPEDRSITDQLYGGDHEHRLKQEIALGIGGLRALRALKRDPEVCHMNEGHAALLALERMRILIEEQGLSFEQAREAVIPGNVFTTHTPVPAGIDRFGADLIEKYFSSWYGRLRTDRRAFLALGRQRPHDESEPFSMAVLALKTAGYSNGVSKLHGEVSRKMFCELWPEVPIEEVPITSVTNGVHVRSYVSDPLDELFVRYIGPRWTYDAADQVGEWTGPERVPDAELWRVHERQRAKLVTWARQRLRMQLQRSGVGIKEIEAADEVLDPEALTIGFARRFATYKRGTLLWRDPDRLAKILSDKDRPVQILYAGKAHPKDDAGKQFIQRIAQRARSDRFRHSVVFLEDYDINVARYLVQGVDVWLNNPRRPMEASGTSGMKAAANGVLNCSILDGWWCEGYDGTNGWSIGRGEDYTDLEYQDQVESRSLYDLLEKQIVPQFYERGDDGLPRAWIRRMKRAMQTCIPVFSTHRMVREYSERFYVPSAVRHASMNRNQAQGARELWDWKMTLFQRWAQVRIEQVTAPQTEALPVGGSLEVSAKIHLGPIQPNWVDVQVFSGSLNDQNSIQEGRAVSLSRDEGWHGEGGFHMYRGKVPCTGTGRFGFAVRVLPKHENLPNPFIPGLITWG
ncbi:MAG: alpha-glucan family phosphorylase [Planctomycetota bacterium]|nr:alpha-glucan family phosphorylase [Planctomycetota bacterium]